MEKLRKACRAIRKSPDLTRDLRALTASRQNGVTVDLDIGIRWNSTSAMISKYLLILNEVNAVLNGNKRGHLVLSSAENGVLAQLEKSLEHASKALRLLSSRGLSLSQADKTHAVLITKLEAECCPFARTLIAELPPC